ncbi:MAG: PAS domain-containing protein [Tannerellaceae bacterium]|jgi:nitrogen fixation/metabolism regulation signal transduction histidine kinase|nr:PAS domain-containing protein [Tannerellaceae bacterium]
MQSWVTAGFVFPLWIYSLRLIWRLYGHNAEKVAFILDAIENSDHTVKYDERRPHSSDRQVNASLNRITGILRQAKMDAVQQEKYYELILNSVSTGILAVDDNGYIFQANHGALRLLGLSVLTHCKQISRIDARLADLIEHIQAGSKQQVSFGNERGTVHLSIRVSEMSLRDKHVRILAINDINSEMEEKEIDSWIRLTRVLTHEIMNAITPVTSLSDTLLTLDGSASPEIRAGLETISATGKGLIAFVESYRRFTHIPTPRPSLFYVRPFAERMQQLATHQNNYPNISIKVDVEPADLIVHADENLTAQVTLNIIKNAMQAIEADAPSGIISIKARCNDDESIFIEISNNGPAIPPEVASQIFIPFFTTKEGGSGVGLSVSRQIMRLHGGSLTLVHSAAGPAFVMAFP